MLNMARGLDGDSFAFIHAVKNFIVHMADHYCITPIQGLCYKYLSHTKDFGVSQTVR